MRARTTSNANAAASRRKNKDNESSFVQTREEQIQDYLRLKREYQQLLDEHHSMHLRRKESEKQIASCKMRMARLVELIEKVKQEHLERRAARDAQ
jgi:hypothetical protein